MKYHIIEEVDDPVKRFADARDLLESLGACVMFLNLIDDKAGSHDGVASEDTERNQDADQTAHPWGYKMKDFNREDLKTCKFRLYDLTVCVHV